MVTTVLALLMLAGIALYFMTPEERAWLARTADAAIRRALRGVTTGSSSKEPFDEWLRSRTRCAVVTPVLIALNTGIFLLMLFGTGAFSDTHTLIDWGGNFAPHTTNGEWWRLVTATFVHSGALHLFATIAGLLPLGLVLERALGRLTVALVYVIAGTLASMVSLWTTPSMSVSLGASGAIFGLYGLLLASLGWAIVSGGRPSASAPALSIPPLTVRRTAAAAAVFLLYNVLTGDLGTASEVTGFFAGAVAGLFIARDVVREAPALRRVALAMTPMLLIGVACAIPLHQVDDVRPEIVRIAAVEEQTAATYDAAVTKFKRRHITADALADLIDRTIMLELQGARARLKAVRNVPREQTSLVAAAEKYFDLREQSWRRRSEGLLRLDMNTLREAELTERAALAAFEKMRSAG
jgi:rhomboid protease GluP